MRFETPLLEGRLIRRYQRFLADVALADGSVVTAHTPNTGSMLGCAEAGSRVWLRDSGNPARKVPLSWELVESGSGTLIGINTLLANRLVLEAIEEGRIAALCGYTTLRREVGYGSEGSRIDLLLQTTDDRPDCYVEVKNVTLLQEGMALFPDAVTLRGRKHLRELMGMVQQGARAVLFFLVQRGDARAFAPADDIDVAYGQALRAAHAAGVEIMAWQANVGMDGIWVERPLPIVL